ncbi:MAG: HDOD domain-containing protein [Planctomycetaceae bacterium]|nr:HDOD domain-containing protein [Planctomycetaceae bacterium]
MKLRRLRNEDDVTVLLSPATRLSDGTAVNTSTLGTPASQSSQQFTVPNHVVRRYQHRLNDVTMLPSAANDALAVARNPNASVHQFTALIERDPKLSADVLRYANSSAFSGGKNVERLDRAVTRLGFRVCEQIILATCMSSLARHVSPELQRAKSLICQHCFATAMIAQRLNSILQLGFRGEEFTAALMHDFGRILIAIVDPELFAAADPLDFREHMDIIDHEREVIGANHCSIGW